MPTSVPVLHGRVKLAVWSSQFPDETVSNLRDCGTYLRATIRLAVVHGDGRASVQCTLAFMSSRLALRRLVILQGRNRAMADPGCIDVGCSSANMIQFGAPTSNCRSLVRYQIWRTLALPPHPLNHSLQKYRLTTASRQKWDKIGLAVVRAIP